MPAPLFRDCAHTLSFRLCGRGSGSDPIRRTSGGGGSVRSAAAATAAGRAARRSCRWRGRCGPVVQISAEGVAEEGILGARARRSRRHRRQVAPSARTRPRGLHEGRALGGNSVEPMEREDVCTGYCGS